MRVQTFMSQIPFRIASLLLIPCLIGDPALSLTLKPASDPFYVSELGYFKQQVIVPRMANFWSHPNLFMNANEVRLFKSEEAIYLIGHRHIHPFDRGMIESFLFGIFENPSPASLAREARLIKWLTSDRHQSLLLSMKRDIALLKHTFQEHGERPLAIGLEISDQDIQQILGFSEDYLAIVNAVAEKLSSMGISDSIGKASELYFEIIGPVIYFVRHEPEFKKKRIQIIGLGDPLLRDEISKTIANLEDKLRENRFALNTIWKRYRLESAENERRMIRRINEFEGALVVLVGERHIPTFRIGVRRPFKEITRFAA